MRASNKKIWCQISELMDVFYQKSAELDLEVIEDYYSQKSRRSFDNVLADIFSTISSTVEIIRHSPEVGRIIDKELIKIIGVFRGQDKRV